MELTPYVEALRRDLIATAAPGGHEVRRAADLLVGSVEASARLVLLEALTDATAEITTKLAESSTEPDVGPHVAVEVRLRGREAQFVIVDVPASPPVTVAGSAVDVDVDGGEPVRLTLRMPEALKESVERRASADGVSVNAWLVRAIAHATMAPAAAERSTRSVSGPRRFTGFVQA